MLRRVVGSVNDGRVRKSGRFGSIRKSEVVDLEGVGVNSNCTRCRLEIAEAEKRQPARQAILRMAKSSFFGLHGAVFRLRDLSESLWHSSG